MTKRDFHWDDNILLMIVSDLRFAIVDLLIDAVNIILCSFVQLCLSFDVFGVRSGLARRMTRGAGPIIFHLLVKRCSE